MLTKVLLYSDRGVHARALEEGACEISGLLCSDSHRLDRIDAQELAEGDWESSCAVLLIPGGRDLAYCESLAGKANDRIREFVGAGGAYLGLCAGAYYGSSLVEFDLGGPLEVCGSRELGFFSGSAVGPLFGPYLYGSEKSALSVRISSRGEQLRVFYDGGCSFLGDGAALLSEYIDLPGKPAAVIKCNVGKGIAVLSGVHPEYSLSSVDSLDSGLSPDRSTFRSEEEDRRRFLAFLLRECGLSVKS